MKIHLPEKCRCAPAVVPFSRYGNPLSEEEIKNGDHLRTVVVDGDGTAIRGFSDIRSSVFSLYPVEIQGLLFEIDKYEKNGIYEITESDRERIKQKYEKAFRELQALLKQTE